MSEPAMGDAAPLTPAMFHILLALAERERHGYDMIQAIDEASGGGFKIGPGTLYRSIKQMLALGLIEESGERPAPDQDDERRRYYRITAAGRRAASAEAARLARLVSAARARRLLGDFGGGEPAPGLGGAQ